MFNKNNKVNDGEETTDVGGKDSKNIDDFEMSSKAMADAMTAVTDENSTQSKSQDKKARKKSVRVSFDTDVDDKIKESETSRVDAFTDIPKTVEFKGDAVKEKEVDKKSKTKENNKQASFSQLLRFATRTDYVLMVIGSLAAMANGSTTPLMFYILSSIFDSFSMSARICPTSGANSTNVSSLTSGGYSTLLNTLKDQAIWMVVIGVAMQIIGYIQVVCWMIPAERQVLMMRKTLFKSILRQNIGWFDCYKSGELTNRLTDDVNNVKAGIGEQIGYGIQYLCTFLAAIVMSFIKGWQLSLVILSIIPVLFVSSILFGKMLGYFTKHELTAYAQAGAVAEEVFTAIRTVFAFNGYKKEVHRYASKLDGAKEFGIKKGFLSGCLIGVIYFVIFSAYAAGFFYGWTLTEQVDAATGQSSFSVGRIFLILSNLIIGFFQVGSALEIFAAKIPTAKAAGYEIFAIIDRVPEIDSLSDQGARPVKLNGDIEFRSVSFHYPSRPDVTLLDGINFKIEAGKTVALVGASGCGKSTCMQLLQRFYDPIEGSVHIDDTDVKKLQLAWLRTHLAVVNQEPVLFGTTIKENIRFGKDGATDAEVVEAAKNANAHDFIMSLPDKYDTHVGDRGGQLSGGQKQRIAIARALVRNPKILLLDEATSALDNESESIVQAALDKAGLGRTTIIVAHRLSTIINANVIYAFDKGKVAESGTHNELMAKKGIYYNLVINQQASTLDKKDEDAKKSEKEPIKQIEISQKTIGHSVEEIVVSNGEKEDAQKTTHKSKKEASLLEIFQLNQPEWYFILVGCIGSVISGAAQPANSLILSKSIALFSLCSYDDRKSQIVLYCCLYVAIGVSILISRVVQGGMFGISGERMTKRLRARAFETMLRQEIGWFDAKENNVGKLCTQLAVDASAVQGAAGGQLGVMLMNVSTMGVGIIISFIYAWPIALIVMPFVPFLILAGIIQSKVLKGSSVQSKETLEDAGKITYDSIGNIRTVVILMKERYFVQQYYDKIAQPFKSAMRSTHVNGLAVGFSSSLTSYATAVAFVMGAYLLQNNLFGIQFVDVIIVFSCLINGGRSVGIAAGFGSDFAKALGAANSLFELFNRVPRIDNGENNLGDVAPNDRPFNPDINLNRVEFTYPSRPEARILRGLELNIAKSKKIAFVGSSGCGKSTVTQLIERFYDPDQGTVNFDKVSTKSYNLHWLRSQIGIVSQEPILFDLSIAENIAYGDNSRTVSMDEIMEAAKKANIHDFVSKLPEGFNTNVGSKGTQLSGGQKQRIAIARALIKNPTILLLDEATSALDTESEKVVQEALDKAQEGRTCIIIAHRLSTIRNCDMIVVLHKGVVTEKGTHDELIRLNGFYAKLNGQQTSSSKV